jgi:hypothetical protein
MTYNKDVHESNLVTNIDSNLPLLSDLADFWNIEKISISEDSEVSENEKAKSAFKPFVIKSNPNSNHFLSKYQL